MDDVIYWTNKLRQAEQELDAARTRTAPQLIYVDRLRRSGRARIDQVADRSRPTTGVACPARARSLTETER
jgi:hypothetical protein